MEDKANFTNPPAIFDNLSAISNDPWSNNSDPRAGPDPPGPFIPLYLYILVSVFNIVIFIVGITGNVLVIVAVCTVKEMRTATNIFLLSLSLADIMVLMVCQPAALAEFFGKDRWFIGEAMCKIVPLMENGVLNVSVLTMLAVTAERYNAICHPFKRHMACTVSTSIKAVVGIWLLACVLSLPFLIMTDLQDARFYDGSPTKVCRTIINEEWRYGYIVFVFVIFFVVPFFVLLFMYMRIIRQLLSDSWRTLTRNDPSAMSTLRSRKQVVRMLIFIVILFFVSLFPIRVLTLWLIFTPVRNVSKLGVEAFLNLVSWARILMCVNSAGNPIIYSLTSTKFKMAFSRLMRQRRLSVNSTRYSFTRPRQGPTSSHPHRLDVIQEEADRTNTDRHAPCLIVRLLFYAETRSRDASVSGCSQNEAFPLKITCTKLEDGVDGIREDV